MSARLHPLSDHSESTVKTPAPLEANYPPLGGGVSYTVRNGGGDRHRMSGVSSDPLHLITPDIYTPDIYTPDNEASPPTLGPHPRH